MKTTTHTLDPYAPIEKAPLFARDAMQSRGVSVRLADPEVGWREVGVVRPSYLLVPNAEVRQMAERIAEASGLAWVEDRVFFDGKRYLYGLVADPEIVYAEVTVGDVLGIGLLVENSYDGSRKLGASLYVHRLACANGMLAPTRLARVRFKHALASSSWRDDLSHALAMLGAAPRLLSAFAASAARLARHELGTPELAAIRRGPLAGLPVSLWGRIVDRYLGEDDPTGWGLLNAATAECWHSERPTVADFGHNETATAGLIRYADRLPGVSDEVGQVTDHAHQHDDGDDAARQHHGPVFEDAQHQDAGHQDAGHQDAPHRAPRSVAPSHLALLTNGRDHEAA